MAEIKASLNHILHSLTELCVRINIPPHNPLVPLINTTAAPTLPLPSNRTTASSILPSNPTIPSSYLVKRLTYSEMQQLRDHGLCLNCNDIDTPSHRCPVKRILLVLPDVDPNIELQSMEKHAPTVPEQLTHASDRKATRLELLEPVDLKAPQFQSVAFDSSVARQIDMGITHHSLHIKAAHNLDFPIDKSFSLYITSLNDRNIMSKGLCSKNNVLFLWSLVEYIIKMGESKVLIFDPGGISHVKKHIRTLTLRTRSFSERAVMIRLHLPMTRSILCNCQAHTTHSNKAQELIRFAANTLEDN